MYLKELTITRFRGIKDLHLDFENNINVLDAVNGAGKTTILDSVLWLLADETLVYGGDNSQNIDMNNPKEELDVEGLFIKSDDTELKLKRTYVASYTKTGEFSSFSNTLYINGAKYTVTEYKARINQEIGLKEDVPVKGFNTIRAIMDFDYLGSIDYKIAREKIEKILKLSSDSELLADKKFAPIKGDLEALLFDVPKIKTKINKAIKDTDTYVGKQETLLSSLEAQNVPVDEAKIKELESKLEALQNSEYKFSEEYLQYQKDHADFSNKVKEAELKYTKALNVYDNLKTANFDIERQIKPKKDQMEVLKTKFETIKNSVQTCPNCGAKLNVEPIKKELFNIKSTFEKIKNEVAELESNFKQLEEVENAEKQMKEAKAEYDSITKESLDFITKNRKMFEDEINAQTQFNSVKIKEVTELRQEIDKLASSSNNDVCEKIRADIKKAQDEKANNELKLELLNDFQKVKIAYLENKTASVFPNIKFVLIEESNTGAITQTCKPTYNNVDYLGLNDGQRILLGFEILEDLKKALGVKEELPIIFNKLHDLDNNNILKLKEITKAQIFTTRSGKTNEIQIKHI